MFEDEGFVMKSVGNRVRIEVTVSIETANAIKKICQELQMPASRVASLLIDGGLDSIVDKSGRKLAGLGRRVSKALDTLGQELLDERGC